MKVILLLIAFLFSHSLFAQTSVISKTAGTLEFIELDHGLASVVQGNTVQAKNSPTGTRGWLEDFAITNVTDSIQIIRKANFGVVYMVNAKDTVDIDVVIEWIYPEKITNDKGEKFKSIRYTTQRPTNIPSASSYSLDETYEMVKGPWKMNMYLENKKVYSRTFILF